MSTNVKNDSQPSGTFDNISCIIIRVNDYIVLLYI